jgi:DNA-binding transcriptional LysR family regulator
LAGGCAARDHSFDGRKVALGSVEANLQSGRLVSVLDEWCPFFPGPFLYYPSRRHMPAGAFIDFARTWEA